jgi:ferrous iron transport protein B
MVRELNRSWAWFSVVWTTGVAYGAAVFFYQAATFAKHPQSSLAWLLGILFVLGVTLFSVRTFALQRKRFTVLLPSGEVV